MLPHKIVALVPPGSEPDEAPSLPELPPNNDPSFLAIAELIEDLQNRVKVLEGRVNALNSRPIRRRIEHHRDPITRQIVSSTIIDE